MNIIIERDHGRIEQILTDQPGVTVTVVDTGSDKAGGDALTLLPSGNTGLVTRLPVIVDPEHTQALLAIFPAIQQRRRSAE